MASRKHSTETKRTCDVANCGNEAQRSVSGKKVDGAGIEISSSPSRNAHLCRNHYREFKKKTKKDRKLQRLDW
ncbi:MAG: hypothetical protein JSV94_04065 [Methanobacteriota archaeon]|nr:MAG: hypothetical protein JSV94_04065 [Euryarchaeota archaeon]